MVFNTNPWFIHRKSAHIDLQYLLELDKNLPSTLSKLSFSDPIQYSISDIAIKDGDV